MRRDDVSDSFLYINEIHQKKSVSNPSRVVALAEQPCVYWMIGWGRVEWGGVNKTSEKHLCCSESPRLLPNSSNMIFIMRIALC